MLLTLLLLDLAQTLPHAFCMPANSSVGCSLFVLEAVSLIENAELRLLPDPTFKFSGPGLPSGKKLQTQRIADTMAPRFPLGY